jgi:hypothetical protein
MHSSLRLFWTGLSVLALGVAGCGGSSSIATDGGDGFELSPEAIHPRWTRSGRSTGPRGSRRLRKGGGFCGGSRGPGRYSVLSAERLSPQYRNRRKSPTNPH